MLDVLVLPHTHWDREWYHSAGRFRQRLVALVDELLDDEPDVPFLLDGQGIVVDDYLAVRPERRDALAERLRAGRIEAGPWYVLADELIPSGEALVRNLLAGRATLAALGAEPPPVLYCPDSFGHPAALPVLAAGFGFAMVVLWRGYGGRRWPAGDAAWWRAPDGSRVLLHHLPPDGYELGSSLPPGREEARARWARLRDVLAPRARLGMLLVQNGADHHARQERLREALASLAAAAAPDRARFATLRDVARLATTRATAALPEVAGELRDSYGYTWTLQGTFATRAGQKRAVARVERLLVREAEPWSAIAHARGGPARLPLVRAAWRRLLECHPHDTLCGCSTDEVARTMDARLEDALAQARGIREDALLDVAGHDPVYARERRREWRPVVVVRNAAPRPRGGVAELELRSFLQDVPVGPGSGGAAAKPTSRRGAPVALDGGLVPMQLLSRDVRHDRTESPRHYPDDDLVEVARAVAWVGPVRGYGTRSFAQESRTAPVVLPEDVTPATAGDRWISNGLLSVHVDGDGRVRLTSAAHAMDLPDVVGFEDVGDRGDTYTHSPVGRLITDARLTSLRVLHRGPIRGVLAATWTVRVPAALRRPGDDEDAGALPGRSGRPVDLAVNVIFELDAGAPFVRLRVSGRNDAKDHRLRIVLRTGVAATTHLADAAFGPVVRAPLVVPVEDRQAEVPPPTAPLHRWATRANERHGVALVSDGLAEYEATPDGAFAVTLVRAVGELSRNDLPERPGHAGWPVPTPGAQCQGRFGAILALVPHGPLDDATLDAIERACDDALLPLRGATLRSALYLPNPTLGAELEGDGLAFGALKQAEDGDGIVLRCVNTTGSPVRGRWRLGFPVRRATLARLDETPLGEPLPIEHDAGAPVVVFEAGPRAVVTLRLTGTV